MRRDENASRWPSARHSDCSDEADRRQTKYPAAPRREDVKEVDPCSLSKYSQGRSCEYGCCVSQRVLSDKGVRVEGGDKGRDRGNVSDGVKEQPNKSLY